MLFIVVFALLPAVLAAALPDILGILFDANSTALPVLRLPYASYRAYSYNDDKDYYRFKNIRFAAPPVGELRWAKPQPPAQETEVQNGSVGTACHQSFTNNLLSWYFENNEATSEDCLFMDVYVPGSAVRGEVKNLPVLDWIYAGGYIFGSKDWFLYDTGLWLENADNDLIYVAANHRVGGFGFLTGPTVEKEATSNVGLHDQRAALQWIQDYIHLLGGDNNTVTAWGLSSGSSSIMHHLIAKGGQSDPLFQRAITNSPAFLPTYDAASMETSFQAFAAQVGCEGKGFTCLRNVSEDALKEASANTTNKAPSGHFGFGPAIDHEYILDLPANEFRKGNYWKNVSVLFSHQTREGVLFTDPSVDSDEKFQALINSSFPNITAGARQELLELYPNRTDESTYNRTTNLISKFAVNCNARWLAQAYEGQTWGYRISALPAIHGEDTFWNWLSSGVDVSVADVDIDISFSSVKDRTISGRVQSFIASFARTGNPNTYRANGTLEIPVTVVNDTLNVLDVGLVDQAEVNDVQTPKNECDWWETSAWTGVGDSG